MKQVPESLTKPFNAEAVEASLYQIWERVDTLTLIIYQVKEKNHTQ